MTAVQHDLGDGYHLEISSLGDGPGPVLSILGGVHGDELEGVLAARTVAGRLGTRTRGGLAGEVRIVAVSNPAAWRAGSRISPVDQLNLARVFPGRPDGTITERAAHAITAHVITGADLLVDLHSAGVAYAMPLFAGYVEDGSAVAARSRAAAYAFGAPLVWEHEGSGPGRSLSAAAALGVPAVYVEGSGGGGLIGDELDRYVDGVFRLLAWLGITDRPVDEVPPPAVLRGDDGDVDSSLSCSFDGYCVTRVRPGQPVTAGQRLADILAEDATPLERIVAPRAGTVMMLRRRATVSAGDGIAMLGPIPEGRTG